jgi:hypothetical protein
MNMSCKPAQFPIRKGTRMTDKLNIVLSHGGFVDGSG